MQRFLFLILGILFTSNLSAQADSSECTRYRTGYFSFTDSLGQTILVDRGKKFQYQRNIVTRVNTQFRINWTGNCTYQITQTLTNSKAARKYKNTTTLVFIDKTDGGNGYSYSCGCKDGSKNGSGYMKKISRKEYYSQY